MSVLPLATFSAPGVPLFGSGGGTTYTAGSNITISSSNVIATSATPTFTNVQTTTLNGSSFLPIAYTRLNPANIGAVINSGSSTTISSAFALTSGRTYRITTAPMSFTVSSGTPATTDNVTISLSGSGSTPVTLGSIQVSNSTDPGESGAPLVCIFKALSTTPGATIVLQAFNSAGSAVTYSPNVNTLFMLEDLGAGF
jgi:hypothetical protein